MDLSVFEIPAEKVVKEEKKERDNSALDYYLKYLLNTPESESIEQVKSPWVVPKTMSASMGVRG